MNTFRFTGLAVAASLASISAAFATDSSVSVSEPGTLPLLLIGLAAAAGLAIRLRRRK